MGDRLDRQMMFLNEIEKLKVVYRRNQTIGQHRPESSAEHSWHVALLALILSEHATEPRIDMFTVLKMLLIHDFVEIYAGDTWIYDCEGSADQEIRESDAAAKLFSMLPDDQALDVRQLWEEFESGSSPEARYAAAIDALQPLSNWLVAGARDESQQRPNKNQVLDRKQHIKEASDTLWHLAERVITESTDKGLYGAE